MIKLIDLLEEIDIAHQTTAYKLAVRGWYPLTPEIAKILNKDRKITAFHITSPDKIKLLKSIMSFDIQSFQIIEDLYNENNKNITIYNYFFNYKMYKHYKYEESKIICLIYEYLEKIDTNTLLFILGYFITFYK